MKPIAYQEIAPILNEKLSHGGVFLTVGKDRPNTMTIGWAFMGPSWGYPVFVALVRPQRYSYPLLTEGMEFTVSIPTKNPLKSELIFAGTQSGRDYDKFDGTHGLTALPAQQVSCPVVAECGLHLECRVRLIQDMTGDRMDPSMQSRAYPAEDYHTMFFGEIVACYSTDE